MGTKPKSKRPSRPSGPAVSPHPVLPLSRPLSRPFAGHKIFAAADDLLTKRLAPLSLTFRTLAPSFYLAYKTARAIVDLAGPGEPTPPEPPVNP